MLSLSKMKMQSFLALFLALGMSVFAGSIKIDNNSPHNLTAKIFSANGAEIEEVTIPKNTLINWADHALKMSGQPSAPYRVVFTCPCGENFGVIENVSQASLIHANSAEGKRTCPQKKDGKKPEKPVTEDPSSSPSEPPSDPIWGPP